MKLSNARGLGTGRELQRACSLRGIASHPSMFVYRVYDFMTQEESHRSRPSDLVVGFAPLWIAVMVSTCSSVISLTPNFRSRTQLPPSCYPPIEPHRANTTCLCYVVSPAPLLVRQLSITHTHTQCPPVHDFSQTSEIIPNLCVADPYTTTTTSHPGGARDHAGRPGGSATIPQVPTIDRIPMPTSRGWDGEEPP